MTTKTPVTILQELMVQRQEIPQYDLIYNDVGTHEPLFKYRVYGQGLSAIGSGKSKKEAKHEAARLLLLMLKDQGPDKEVKENPILKEVVSCYSPYDDTIKDNTVGALQTFCCENLLPNPSYELISDTGPPHFRSFTIRCVVSSFKTEATAHTKKQAKHRCSAAMITKLKTSLLSFIEFRNEDNLLESDNSSSDRESVKICELAKKTAFFALPVAEYCNIFNSGFYRDTRNFAYLEEVKSKYSCANEIPEPMEVLKQVASELFCELDINKLPCKGSDYIINIFLVSKPGWSFIGIGKSYDDAVTNAVIEALDFLIIMSS